MKIVIVGCGRVGASAAEIWDAAGHDVIVLDMSTRAFERLASSFGGTAVRGDGTDEDVLRRSVLTTRVRLFQVLERRAVIFHEPEARL